jgi:hypothetical protein
VNNVLNDDSRFGCGRRSGRWIGEVSPAQALNPLHQVRRSLLRIFSFDTSEWKKWIYGTPLVIEPWPGLLSGNVGPANGSEGRQLCPTTVMNCLRKKMTVLHFA